MVRKNPQLFSSSADHQGQPFVQVNANHSLGSSNGDWQQLASLANNADEFPGENPAD
jgi:hypothetical protein